MDEINNVEYVAKNIDEKSFIELMDELGRNVRELKNLLGDSPVKQGDRL